MATPQLSPGVLVREVDLTVGRADNVLDNIGAIAGPFSIGPVDSPVDIATEQDLINVFGKPQNTDAQYEYWMSASSYLSYGGVLKVVRTGGNTLRTANAQRNSSGVSTAGNESLQIKNFDDYQSYYSGDTQNYIFAAKSPGSWANKLKVCVIDNKADQIIGINTNSLSDLGANIGYGVTVAINNANIPGIGSFTGYLKGIITGVSTEAQTSTVDVKIVSRVSNGSVSYDEILTTTLTQQAASGVTTVFVNSVSGVNNTLSYASISGIATNIKVVSVGATSVTLQTGLAQTAINGSTITFSNQVSTAGTETKIAYGAGNDYSSILTNKTLCFVDNSGVTNAKTATSVTVNDWYDQQTLNLNTPIYWSSIAPKPSTSSYASQRGSSNDEIHVVVVDDTGSVTGVQGSILEKHLGLSKASDSVSAVNSPQKIWWKDYLALNSSYVYVGDNPSDNLNKNEAVVQTGFGIGNNGYVGLSTSDGQWNSEVRNKTFSALGNVTYELTGGKDYDGNGMRASLSSLLTSYDLFSNRDKIQVDYLICGPGLTNKDQSQEKANHIIGIADQRKDCMAVISPYRGDVLVGTAYENYGPITNTTTQTNNIISFFTPLKSSSYAVFDSGYKYTYDRFNNKFVYIPCNGDIAGLMCRTNIVAYPWFSPAGQQRGIINNAIKLAYNPNKAQRDQLYPLRINSIVTQPGIGTLLFGDKTALGFASAFDRINVRRLFLTIEQALQRAAQAQLFELNDELTRANFKNIVEPYLRDIQAKRGLYGFLVVCDTSNNTPDVIDNNEFRADIYLKPAKAINYVTLTFVATRTGVSFEEVAGTV